jgi:hypothetical protein
MQIHPSVTVSVRPAPIAPERPAATPRGTDAVRGDGVRGRIVVQRETPFGQNVRAAAEGLLARQVSGEAVRGAPQQAEPFDLRSHLAEIDEKMGKRIEFFGREHGLNADEVRELSQSFHAKLRKIYEAARDTDAGPKRVNRAVRRAFQGVRADLHIAIGRSVDSNTTVSSDAAAGGNGVTPTSEAPPSTGSGSGSGSGTTSTVPGVTVSVGTAPPPPPIPVADPATEPTDPLAVLANALTQFVDRFDSMMDLFETLIANGIGNSSGSGGGSAPTNLSQALSDLLAASNTGNAVDQNG